MSVSPQDWNEREDCRRGGGHAIPAVLEGVKCDVTIWDIGFGWPVREIGVLALREYEGGSITAACGRPHQPRGEEDGA